MADRDKMQGDGSSSSSSDSQSDGRSRSGSDRSSSNIGSRSTKPGGLGRGQRLRVSRWQLEVLESAEDRNRARRPTSEIPT